MWKIVPYDTVNGDVGHVNDWRVQEVSFSKEIRGRLRTTRRVQITGDSHLGYVSLDKMVDMDLDKKSGRIVNEQIQVVVGIFPRRGAFHQEEYRETNGVPRGDRRVLDLYNHIIKYRSDINDRL